MTRADSWKYLVIGGVATVAIIATLFLDPIPQDPGYHRFADRDPLFWVSNFWNVVTNLPFLVIGMVGLIRLPRLEALELRAHYVVFCVGITLVAFGSAYYHLEPSTSALVWDRLPMTIAFMALFAAVVSDRLSWFLGRALLWPLVALGIASIAWWIRTELAGQGDLRPYAIVQFLPMLLMPMILLMWKQNALSTKSLWLGFGAYAAAKLAEQCDALIFAATGSFSGHSLKHLLAALAAWCIVRSFQKSPASAL